MSERDTMRGEPAGRGTLVVASLAAALVLASLLCAFAFAESSSRATAASPPDEPAPSAPPATAPADDAPDEPGDADASLDGEETGEDGSAIEASGVPVTQLVAKDFMVASDKTVEGDRYFVGNNTDVEGTIDGDFFTFSKGADDPRARHGRLQLSGLQRERHRDGGRRRTGLRGRASRPREHPRGPDGLRRRGQRREGSPHRRTHAGLRRHHHPRRGLRPGHQRRRRRGHLRRERRGRRQDRIGLADVQQRRAHRRQPHLQRTPGDRGPPGRERESSRRGQDHLRSQKARGEEVLRAGVLPVALLDLRRDLHHRLHPDPAVAAPRAHDPGHGARRDPEELRLRDPRAHPRAVPGPDPGLRVPGSRTGHVRHLGWPASRSSLRVPPARPGDPGSVGRTLLPLRSSSSRRRSATPSCAAWAAIPRPTWRCWWG